MTVPEQHQKRIALSILRASDVGARIMGGMTKDEARKFLSRVCKWREERIARYEND